MLPMMHAKYTTCHAPHCTTQALLHCGVPWPFGLPHPTLTDRGRKQQLGEEGQAQKPWQQQQKSDGGRGSQTRSSGLRVNPSWSMDPHLDSPALQYSFVVLWVTIKCSLASSPFIRSHGPFSFHWLRMSLEMRLMCLMLKMKLIHGLWGQLWSETEREGCRSVGGFLAIKKLHYWLLAFFLHPSEWLAVSSPMWTHLPWHQWLDSPRMSLHSPSIRTATFPTSLLQVGLRRDFLKGRTRKAIAMSPSKTKTCSPETGEKKRYKRLYPRNKNEGLESSCA